MCSVGRAYGQFASFGAQVIDRALLQGGIQKASLMLAILRQGRTGDWGKIGRFSRGLGGARLAHWKFKQPSNERLQEGKRAFH